MKIEIIDERDQPLLERKVVKATITFQGSTPPRKDVIAGMAAQLKVKEELLVLKAIRTVFGRMKAVATVHVYKNTKQVEAVEPAYRLQRGKEKPKKGAEPAEEEAPAAPPAKEAKPEEKKEDAPKDEKPAKEAKPEEKKEDAPKDEKPAKEEKPAEEKKEEKPADEKKEG